MKVILGTMTFGTGDGGRIADRATVRAIISLFKESSSSVSSPPELDTARLYCDGDTEHLLGELQPQSLGFHIHTKVFPFAPGDHSPARLREQFETSLKALKTDRVEVLYLHAPDHSVPYIDTLRCVDELHREGKFVELGLSNYSAWEVMEIHHICQSNNLVIPTLYQGMYNALTREVEPELFPCLRKLNMRFYAYNPLCGGFLSGNYDFNTQVEPGSRFDPTTVKGDRYRKRYWNSTYFEAIEGLKGVVARHGVSLVSAAHRWLVHHSCLDEKRGDGVIVGVSTLKHAEENIGACYEGPLHEEIVEAFDEACRKAKLLAPPYFR